MAYTKLFNSILTSTIWVESDRTRIVWITMLALADKNGEVQASIPGLARVAGVPLEDCETAINKFLSPDPYSRTPDDQGRRIERIDGGWHLLNHQKYRELASKEESKNANAIRQQRHREKVARNASVTAGNGAVTHGRDIADTDSDADTKKIPLPLAGAGELFEPTPAATPKPVKVKAAPKPRSPDAVFDALAEVSGMAGAVNDMNAGRIAVAKKNILQCTPAASPDEIRRRAANYRHIWPSMTLTPTALAMHWTQCERGTVEPVRVAH